MADNKPTTQKDVVTEIFKLLSCDCDVIIEKIEKEPIDYLLNRQQIKDILEKIFTHEKAENNLSALKNSNIRLPNFLQIINKEYEEFLRAKDDKKIQPINYDITSEAYRTKQQSEFTQSVIDTKTTSAKLLDDLEKLKNEYEEKISQTKDGLITLTVTVLGIFSSLTFALSGSLNILDNVFETGNTFAETLFKYSLVGFFVANLIFLLLYTISKMNNKSIAMHCSKCKTFSSACTTCDISKGYTDITFEYKKDCFGCEHKNTSCRECKQTKIKFICKWFHKFLYITIINIVCIVSLAISVVLGVTGKGDFSFGPVEASTVVESQSEGDLINDIQKIEIKIDHEEDNSSENESPATKDNASSTYSD